MSKQGDRQTPDSFSEWVTQWERTYNEFANQVMGTEGYSQAMNEMQNAQLSAQKHFAQTMTQQLAALNMPSREDVQNIADALLAVNRRLERIEEKLAVSSPSKSTRRRPPRTKKPDTANTDNQSGSKEKN